MKKTLLLLISLSILVQFFHSSHLFAARPLTTDDAWTMGKGQFQVETGFDASRQDNHDREYSPSLTLTYGLLKNLDVGLGGGYLFFHPKEGKKENGLADTELKLKYHSVDEKG
ncbi:MAG: hypothetical protein AB1502_16185 [Thermodesulfobacteriota bacterium]